MSTTDISTGQATGSPEADSTASAVRELSHEQLSDQEFLRELLYSGLPALAVEASVGHRDVADAIARAMGKGWKSSPEGAWAYGPERKLHLDGIKVNPYLQVHTTLPKSDSFGVASHFMIYRFAPTEAQHNVLKRFFAASPDSETNNNMQYSVETELHRILSQHSQGQLVAVEAFSRVVLSNQTMVFANGYDASAQYDGHYLTAHHVRSVDSESGEAVSTGRRVALSVVEPIRRDAAESNPINRRPISEAA